MVSRSPKHGNEVKSMKSFDESHCIGNGGLINIPCDYERQVLVLSLNALNEAHRIPENQLFWCEFRVHERLVGTFLNGTPETESFLYTDFIGVLEQQYLPKWAKESLEVINRSQPETDSKELCQTLQQESGMELEV